MLLTLTSVVTLSQSNETKTDQFILIDKATHEELRKNIEDYKNLIVEVERLKVQITSLQQQNQSSNDQIISYQKMITELQQKIIYLNQRIQSLTEKLDNSSVELLKKTGMYEEMVRLHHRDQAKIYKMNGYQTRFRTQSVVIGFLSVVIVVLLGQSH